MRHATAKNIDSNLRTGRAGSQGGIQIVQIGALRPDDGRRLQGDGELTQPLRIAQGRTSAPQFPRAPRRRPLAGTRRFRQIAGVVRRVWTVPRCARATALWRRAVRITAHGMHGRQRFAPQARRLEELGYGGYHGSGSPHRQR